MCSSKVSYSPNETKLLEIMRNLEKPATAFDLSELFFGIVNPPYHAHHQINATMRTLMLKLNHNGEIFGIEKSPRRGPHPIEFRYVEKINRRAM